MAFAWSWSALDNFETCPKKYWHTRIRKDTKEPEGEAMMWGKQVHEALAERVSKGRKLPDTMPYEKHADMVLENTDRTKVVLKVEQQLAVTEDMRPCGYFDKQVDPWLRVVADVLKVREDKSVARIVDWKTGKGKFRRDPFTGRFVSDSDQLLLSAAVVMAHYPVETVWTQFFWLQEDVVTDAIFTKEDLAPFWNRILPRVDRMENAYKTTEYPPKPSGLCVRHCPVTGCPYHGKGSR
jgi:hypothetical protein